MTLHELLSNGRAAILLQIMGASCLLWVFWGPFTKRALRQAGVDTSNHGSRSPTLLHVLYFNRARIKHGGILFLAGCVLLLSFLPGLVLVLLPAAISSSCSRA